MGQALANAFSSCISADILPDGKMYQNIAEKIMLPMLKGNYDLVSKASVTVQNNLNKAAQIVLKAQSAAFDGERATNLVHKVSSYADYNNAAWVLNEPIKDFTVCVADNTLKKNAEFQAKSGLSPVIVRKAESKCCKWCSSLSGVYQYPNDVPKDVYRRHDNCRCTVDLKPGNGKKQNVWKQKQWTDEAESDKIELRKQVGITHKLPNRQSAIIPEKKISNYCLLADGKHSKEFFAVGYTPNDSNRLMEDIVRGVSINPAHMSKQSTPETLKYLVDMPLGVTTTKPFRTVWWYDNGDYPRFITAHRIGEDKDV